MEKLRVAFMGSPDFAVPCLKALLGAAEVDLRLVVTQTDKPAGRGQKLMPPPVKAVASAAGIEVVQPPSLKKPPFAEVVRGLDLDLIVVVAYGRILPPDLLAVPRLGCWNVHGSLLPKYRGAAPIQWAILRGEAVTGVTLMQMEAGLDTGPMLLKREMAIAEDDTAGSLFEKLAPVGAALLLEGIGRARELVAEKQDDAQATLAPMLSKSDGRVDWLQPARRVRDLIRGMDPWPGAFTMLGGEPLKLWRSKILDVGEEGSARGAEGGREGVRAGTVLEVGAEGLLVACGEGSVVVAEGQLPGRRRMPMAALAAGRAIARGTVLGT